MVMQLRLMFLRKVKAAIEIERVFRGYCDRKLVLSMHLWRIIQKSHARIIQRSYRAYRIRLTKGRFWVAPSEQWVMDNCGRFLNRMIHQMRRKMLARMALKSKMEGHVTCIQKDVRMFLCKVGAIKLDGFRSSLRNWVKPQFAIEYYQYFLRSKNFFMSNHLLGDAVGNIGVTVTESSKKIIVHNFFIQFFD